MSHQEYRIFLLIETSLGGCAVRLVDGSADVIQRMTVEKFSVSRHLGPFVNECLAAKKLNLTDVTHVVASHGPGYFTGIRILLSHLYGWHAHSLLVNLSAEKINKNKDLAHQNPASLKRRWLGVSSLSMIMLSCLLKESTMIRQRTLSKPCQAVFLPSGYQKGFLAWSEEEVTPGGMDNGDSPVLAPDEGLKNADMGGTFLLDSHQNTITVNDRKIHTASVSWLPQTKEIATTQTSTKLTFSQTQIMAIIAPGDNNKKQPVSWRQMFTALPLEEAISQTLDGMHYLCSPQESPRLSWLTKPPTAEYLRGHYADRKHQQKS
ncbi:MAG: hypothetical protein OXC40_01630 [Proteobacteria bacterium]|nr:hypothetical protein [Pseudomonadota bacterium]